MIGDGWNEDPSVRPQMPRDTADRLRILIVTGSRAEFGLLRPVMHAVAAESKLELYVVAAGSHLVLPAETFHDVRAEFNIADVVPMQMAGHTGRAADVEAVSKGVARFGRIFERLKPHWVVVLGDRIEAFAAGIAANIGGYPLAHIHGGDRAEGISDEAMRHALTKIANLHFPATLASAERITRMGEAPNRIHVVGSPSIDDLGGIPALDDESFAELGKPKRVLLFHPVGRTDEIEEAATLEIIEGVLNSMDDGSVLALYPNIDPGRDGIVRALIAAEKLRQVKTATHLRRGKFIGLLKRLAATKGVLVGNSSAALIEAAALKVPVVDIGTRQNGRERCENVIHVDREYATGVTQAIKKAEQLDLSQLRHPYGDGTSGKAVAKILAALDPDEPGLLRKRCTY